MRNAILSVAILLAACGGGTEAYELGVGAQCAATSECNVDIPELTCLTQFKGGYCGLQGCQSDLDCPEASACVAPGDGNNYCFRVCVDKGECNVNRDVENESNCSSSITFVDGDKGRKACLPPSGS